MNERDDAILARYILEMAQEMSGNIGLAIIAALLSNGPMRDEDIAKITGLSILTIRGVISQMISAGFVTYFQERARTNWVDYYFYIDPLALRVAIKDRVLRIIELIEEFLSIIKREEIKWCDQCNLFYKFEEIAFSNGGEPICPVCGNKLDEISDEFCAELRNRIYSIVEKLKEFWKRI